ncbi:MAG: RimK family protein [Pseudomonadota bacterium]
MTTQNFIIVDNPTKFDLDITSTIIISAKDYLLDQKYSEIRNARIFNLCRSYKYQKIGYYVSLIAEARGHSAIPSVTTIQDFSFQSIIRIVTDELDEIIQKSFNKIIEKEYILYVYFGQTVRKEFEKLGKQIYQLFQAPFIKVNFAYNKKWYIQQIYPITFNAIIEEHKDIISQFANNYFSKKRFPKFKIQQYLYDIAILVNPDEESPPSCPKALKYFEDAAYELDCYPEFIKKEDFNRLNEFDVLFIRETTSVNHHTYKFSRRAFAEGLVVIDDPWSILRCSNKIYLKELLSKGKILTPKTFIFNKDSLKLYANDINFPCVLKQPDSSFSRGVTKIENWDNLISETDRLFINTDLVILQDFVPSDFDWRIIILDKKPLLACKYYMAKNHWQIYNWKKRGAYSYGNSEAIPLYLVPDKILKTALKAANLIGDGFYGVDLKQINGEPLVIEINDNPSIEAGYEDKLLKKDLYLTIIKYFISKIQQIRI